MKIRTCTGKICLDFYVSKLSFNYCKNSLLIFNTR